MTKYKRTGISEWLQVGETVKDLAVVDSIVGLTARPGVYYLRSTFLEYIPNRDKFPAAVRKISGATEDGIIGAELSTEHTIGINLFRLTQTIEIAAASTRQVLAILEGCHVDVVKAARARDTRNDDPKRLYDPTNWVNLTADKRRDVGEFEVHTIHTPEELEHMAREIRGLLRIQINVADSLIQAGEKAGFALGRAMDRAYVDISIDHTNPLRHLNNAMYAPHASEDSRILARRLYGEAMELTPAERKILFGHLGYRHEAGRGWDSGIN